MMTAHIAGSETHTRRVVQNDRNAMLFLFFSLFLSGGGVHIRYIYHLDMICPAHRRHRRFGVTDKLPPPSHLARYMPDIYVASWIQPSLRWSNSVENCLLTWSAFHRKGRWLRVFGQKKRHSQARLEPQTFHVIVGRLTTTPSGFVI